MANTQLTRQRSLKMVSKVWFSAIVKTDKLKTAAFFFSSLCLSTKARHTKVASEVFPVIGGLFTSTTRVSSSRLMIPAVRAHRESVRLSLGSMPSSLPIDPCMPYQTTSSCAPVFTCPAPSGYATSRFTGPLPSASTMSSTLPTSLLDSPLRNNFARAPRAASYQWCQSCHSSHLVQSAATTGHL